MPERGAIVAGKYRIEEQLGEGGMGVVYAATHEVTGKPVALKWLPADKRDAERRARLLREAHAAGRITHPNVVDVYDVGEHEGAVFLVMERLVGVPLGVAMEGGPMAPQDAVRLLMPVLRGVAAAHACGVIHRDLKPDNVFLCEDGQGTATTVKVLDFGISKVQGPDMGLTATGVVLGTPLYMSTEQLTGEKDLDGRCDQYALACLLYEMIEGAPPYEGRSYAELSAMKLKEKPRPFAQPVPRKLQNALRRGMARNRKHRFPDLEAFAEALEPFAEGVRFKDPETDWSGVYPARAAVDPARATKPVGPGSPTSVVSVDEDAPTVRTTRRVPRALIAAALAIVAGIAVGGWLLSRGEPAEEPGRAELGPEGTPASAPAAEPSEAGESAPTDVPDEPNAEPEAEEVAGPVLSDELEVTAAESVELAEEGAASETEEEATVTRRTPRRTRPARTTPPASTGAHRTRPLRLEDF
ncbi:MAG: hypothetical protein CMN31_14980 [Sandaracinus sp.]|nr:hypothetical protein [Sandaracinus sp.]MBJ72617.1 hypothetical protein [Sandaracinus sp.]